MSTVGTTGKFGKIRIFNDKAAPGRRIDKVDFCPVEVRIKFFLRCQHHTIEVISRIDRGIEFRIEIEGVLHATAPAAEDTDPQKRLVSKILCCLDLSYFVDCYWRY